MPGSVICEADQGTRGFGWLRRSGNPTILSRLGLGQTYTKRLKKHQGSRQSQSHGLAVNGSEERNERWDVKRSVEGLFARLHDNNLGTRRRSIVSSSLRRLANDASELSVSAGSYCHEASLGFGGSTTCGEANEAQKTRVLLSCETSNNTAALHNMQHDVRAPLLSPSSFVCAAESRN